MSDRDCPHGRKVGKCADCDVERLEDENEALKTVMIAAAEEISAHWDAHCDDDGYGPANLMHRLEKGIPSQYGYTAGDFDRFRALNAKLMAENEALREANEAFGKRQEWWNEKMVALEERNAELVEALSKCVNALTWELGGEPLDTMLIDARDSAYAALAKVGARNE